MADSIARKAFLIALAVAFPSVLAVYFSTANGAVRTGSLIWAAVLILGSWFWARALTSRLDSMTRFVDHLLDTSVPRGHLPASDDEFGQLARSLSRMAPQIDEIVNRLTNELTRREAILGSMTDGVLAVDARLNVTFCNTAFSKTVGNNGPTEGVPLIKIVRDPALFQMVKQVLDSGVAVRQRLHLSTPGMNSFDVHVVPLASTSSRGAMAILHDVTPGERLERVKRDFIANVSHEFRTPLATIQGYAETLLDGGLEDEANRRRFVEIIQANGVRLNNIAADLLTLSELEFGRPATQPGPISLSDALGNAIRAIEPAARLMNVELRAGPVPDCYLLGYGFRLEQALLNLLDNAVKFNKPNGEVRVQVHGRPQRQIEIRVSDSGVGIPQEDRSRIFERFYRVDKARSRQQGGTGLGLSIVKHAVEQMGGTVSVESELGKGSTFIVSLPESNPPSGIAVTLTS
jgi:two-component system, OmpR family, phosphate regulon sensor histidine kinase PhoR